jgi:hypothetical protein
MKEEKPREHGFFRVLRTLHRNLMGVDHVDSLFEGIRNWEDFSFDSLCGKKGGGSVNNLHPPDAHGQESPGVTPNKHGRSKGGREKP